MPRRSTWCSAERVLLLLGLATAASGMGLAGTLLLPAGLLNSAERTFFVTRRLASACVRFQQLGALLFLARPGLLQCVTAQSSSAGSASGMAGATALNSTASTGQVLQTAYLSDMLVRLYGPTIVPFTLEKQIILLRALQEAVIPTVGPIELLTYTEFTNAEPYNNETTVFVDLAWRLYINFSLADVQQLASTGNLAPQEARASARFASLIAFLQSCIENGLPIAARFLHYLQSESLYTPSAVMLRPMALWVTNLQLTGSAVAAFDDNSATLVLTALRSQLIGPVASYVALNHFNVQENLSVPVVQFQVTVTTFQCATNFTNATCVAQPQTAITDAIEATNMTTALLAEGLNLTASVTSVIQPASPTGNETTLSAVYTNNTVPWQLDRLDQTSVNLDDKYVPANDGTGVNVYLLSSGILSTHEEFQYSDPSKAGSRVQPLYGYKGLNPLTDCDDASLYYGYGTYAASLIGGLQNGVAKNVTLYSVRVRDKCLFDETTLWQIGAVPGAINAVVQNAIRPAVMVFDFWWGPGQNSFDNDATTQQALTAAMTAAAAANITIVVPGAPTTALDPCNNLFSQFPEVISVGPVDLEGRRTILAGEDSNNRSCITLWAPGGRLGLPIAGANPLTNSSYISIVPAVLGGTFVTAGVAAQYLSAYPTATPTEVKAALLAMAARNQLTDIGSSANTNLVLNLTAAPVPIVITRNSSSSSSGLSGGAIAGIVVGALAAALLLACCLLWLCCGRRRGNPAQDQANKALAMQSWAVNPKDLKICKHPDGSEWELGQGNFGRVLKGLKNDVQEVALKMTIVRGDELQSQQDFISEIAMMQFVSRDKNIVQFYGACIWGSNLCLVVEYMGGGDLCQALGDDTTGKLRWYANGKRIALDIARGLVFLHFNNITHRDIKSKNILLSKDGAAKIGDVGLAKVMAEGYLTQDEALGTFAWAAPELLMGERCTEKVDVYSFGVVLWEIVTHEMPIRGAMRDPICPDECPEEVAAVMYACVQKDPKERPSATEVYKMLEACPGVMPDTTYEERAGSLQGGMMASSAPTKPLVEALNNSSERTSNGGHAGSNPKASPDNTLTPTATASGSDGSGGNNISKKPGLGKRNSSNAKVLELATMEAEIKESLGGALSAQRKTKTPLTGFAKFFDDPRKKNAKKPNDDDSAV